MERIVRFLDLVQYNGDEPDYQFAQDLINGLLFFKAPNQLNDPFEVSPVLDGRGLDKARTNQLIGVVRGMLSLSYGITPAEAERELLKRISKMGIEKYAQVHREQLKTLYFDLMRQNMESSGVCCFVQPNGSSEGLAHEKLMWSLYTNKASGVRLEFDKNALIESIDTSNLESSRKELARVSRSISYQKTRPKIDVWRFFLALSKSSSEKERERIMLQKIFKPYLFTKSEAWRMENEFRISIEGASNKLLPFDTLSLKAISLGPRCEEKVRTTLIESFIDSIPIYDVRASDSSYALVSKRI
ncbi:hypothetical protein CEW91_02725 [Idiomarina piscisalsi]|uniref:DUF2971 domain-containing protein n=1 Tax=Idiomarina piscisalsi TaxID=1096243 RepID=A0ABM6LRP7_9GAMM|nr:DUF2971 domain-containing protein [Idiomarina piscisalsi]ASG65129.1 hypothetical protein CEW91_02725 [Idiomarina piscisalsi]